MRLGVLLAVGIACGCQSGSEPASRSGPPADKSARGGEEAGRRVVAQPQISRPPREPVSVTVHQRSTTALPPDDVGVRITVDDIKRGQVLTSLSLENGELLHAPVSLRRGETLPFRAAGRQFELELTALDNQLIGDDAAVFVVRSVPDAVQPGASTSSPPLTERQKIERLIEWVAREQGAVFIRNGEEHSGSDAAAHLRRKWEAAGDRIRTADEFIEQLASRSSLTGETYLIRTPDGVERPAADSLRDVLRNLEAPSVPAE